jgi:hypothetical protein
MDRQINLPLGYGCFADLDTLGPHYTVFGGFCMGLGLPEWADQYLPGPGSGAGYKASEYLFPLLLMLIAGGRSLEDIRLIRNNKFLRDTLKLTHVPSPDAIGDWLRRTGARGGLEGLARINQLLIKRGVINDGQETLTLDICAMRIAAEKITAKKMPDGHRGYRPLIGFLNEMSLVADDLFYEGDVTISANLQPFIQHCLRQLPERCTLKMLRAAGPLPRLTDLGQFYLHAKTDVIIGIDADEAILQRIRNLTESEWQPYRAGRLAVITEVEPIADQPIQLVIWRRPYQAVLFGDAGDTDHYLIVATNRPDSPERVMGHYGKHIADGNTRIQFLENGFALERMPCGQTEANAVFFRIGTIAHNVYQLYSSRIGVNA